MKTRLLTMFAAGSIVFAACEGGGGGGGGSKGPERVEEIEPNDSMAAAMDLASSVLPGPGLLEGTCAMSGDEDWFTVRYPGQTLAVHHTASLGWNDAGGANLDLVIGENQGGFEAVDEDESVPPGDSPASVTFESVKAEEETYVGITCVTAPEGTKWTLDLTLAVATPTPPPAPGPSPTPTPYPGTYCSVLWTTPGSAAGLFNMYEINMPAAMWTSGTRTFDDVNVLGLYYRDFDPIANDVVLFGYADGGTFDLTVAGRQPGQTVTISDSSQQTYLDAFGMVAGVIATGGEGSFTGVWSNPDSVGEDFPESAGADVGTGTIAIRDAAGNHTLGSTMAYGICFVPAN